MKRVRCDKVSFDKEQRRFPHQFAITSKSGRGSGTLLGRLEKRFGRPYRFVSGGDMMRQRAEDQGFPSIEEFVEYMKLHPHETSHDRWCDNRIRQFALQDYGVFESRLAHVNVPCGFKVLLECPVLACASRMSMARWERDFPGMTIERITEELEMRDKKDEERYHALYPGFLWEPKDFDLVIDTDANCPEDVEWLVMEGHRRWLKGLSPELIIRDIDLPVRDPFL